MNRLLARTGALLVLGSVLFGSACRQGEEALAGATPAKEIRQLEATVVPSELLGLTVTQEDQKETLAGLERSYVEAVALYSLRTEDLLQATLQISKFNKNADFRSAGFRSSLLSQIGGSRPKAVRMGKDTVYLTTGTKQRISIWFREEYLFILSTRDEFIQPRTLLREALEIQP